MITKLLKKYFTFDMLQKIVIEITGNLIIIALALIAGYYIRVMAMQ